MNLISRNLILAAVLFAAVGLLNAEIVSNQRFGSTAGYPAAVQQFVGAPVTWLWVEADVVGQPEVTHVVVTLSCVGRSETKQIRYIGRPVNVLFKDLTPASAAEQSCVTTVAGFRLVESAVTKVGTGGQ